MPIMLATEELNTVEGKVVEIRTQPEACLRIVTESGVTLVCSTTANIYASDGEYYMSPDLEGKEVAIMKNGEARFDKVIRLDMIGVLDVVPMDTGDNNFWAGEKDGEYIMHHNIAMEGRYSQKH